MLVALFLAHGQLGRRCRASGARAVRPLTDYFFAFAAKNALIAACGSPVL